MDSLRKSTALCIVYALLFSLCLPPHSQAGDFFLFAPFQRKKPRVPEIKRDPVERLAQEIDWLESHLETYGTIVPKHPNVWGEARLTKHRHEYEEEMRKELARFRETIQANVSTRDQSFLGVALSLGAAAGGGTVPTPASMKDTFNVFYDEANAIQRAETELRQAQAVGSLALVEGTPPKPITAVALEPVIYLQQKSRYLEFLNELRRINEGDDTADSPGYALNVVRIPVSVLPGKKTREGYGAEITFTAQPYLSEELLPMTFRNLVINDCENLLSLPLTNLLNQRLGYASGEAREQPPKLYAPPQATEARPRGPKLPLTSSSLTLVIGEEGIKHIRDKAKMNLAGRVPQHDLVHWADVRTFVHAELQAAYDLLRLPEMLPLWSFASPPLVAAIRKGDKLSIDQLRSEFESTFFSLSRSIDPAAASLTWTIIFNSALLNDRLIQDMREVAIAKGCGCLQDAPEWPVFFGPDPPPAARVAFNEYVRCRWPIHVFALDPVTDDQNVGEFASIRREMQVAVAVALATGNMNANAAMNFMRRMELDVETIALNRTAVGFSHGSDTFGWRFYPRVQTPGIRSTLEAVQETVFGGPSKEQLLKERALEAGMRECVAVMLMPSFVPYAVFESRANWFHLVNPAHKELALHDAMKISRTHQWVRTSLEGLCDGGLYRPGDVHLLRRAVDQIDRKLPLQSMTVQIPYENAVGGFEMFNSGITDLAPELLGWYGEPGVRVAAAHCAPPPGSGGVRFVPGTNAIAKLTAEQSSTAKTTAAATSTDITRTEKVATEKTGVVAENELEPVNAQCAGTCDGTTMFLVGDNFSVHDTKVIAGGRCVPFVLMSRQVMRVTIPENVSTFVDLSDNQQRQYVDVHVATPYGVSQHLAIPVAHELPCQQRLPRYVEPPPPAPPRRDPNPPPEPMPDPKASAKPNEELPLPQSLLLPLPLGQWNLFDTLKRAAYARNQRVLRSAPRPWGDKIQLVSGP